MFPNITVIEFLIEMLYGTALIVLFILKYTWPGLLLIAGVKVLISFLKWT